MSIKKYTLLLMVIFNLLIAHVGFGQVEQISRYEVNIENSFDFFKIIPAGENGILLIRPNRENYDKNKMAWQIIVVDTALTEKFVHTLFLLEGYEITGYDNVDEKVYLLFQVPPSRSDDNLIFEIDLITGYYQLYNAKKTINIQLTEFEIIGNSAIFGGYVNARPTVIQYFLTEGKTKVYPGFYLEKSKLLQIDVNNRKGIITVLTSFQTINNRMAINIKKFTSEGEMFDNFQLTPEGKLNLIDGKNVSINMEDDITAGTYSIKKSEYSRGIFLAHVDENGSQNILYYNYADFENFFSYMKARKQKRVKERIDRKKVKGKKLKLNYRLMVHDIVKYHDSYILLGEAYYPKYNNNSYYGGFINSNYRYGKPTYFAGYKYTHAVIICFDSKGKYLWDNSFEINDVLSFDLVKFVEISPREDEIVLLYNYENVIRSKIIKGEEVIEGKSFDDVLLKFQDDEVKNNNSEFGGLKLWYGDKFYAYGIQKIKNIKDADVKLNREVFFINKIIYN